MRTFKNNLDIIQQKAKERTVKTQNIEYDLETLVKKIEKNVIKLNPDYQRNHRWTDETSSRLIESLILNIPIPLIYISQDIDVDEEAEDDVARYSVIDGQQRLTAIFNFFKNKYPLTELDSLRELNGSYYKDLPPFLIRRLEERTIKCLRIDSMVDSEVKYDIFERLNSGSVKLESQELRNATCRGPFKDIIKNLSKNALFVKMVNLNKDGSRVKKMEDQELILRFFSLTYENGYLKYKGGFKDFLTARMKYFNTLDKNSLDKFEPIFIKTLMLINKTLGEEPFAKYKFEKGTYYKKSKFNAAVFDSITVPFCKLIEDNRKMEGLTFDKFKDVFKNTEYFSSIEGSVNDTSKLVKRIETVSGVINGYISA
ncbi:MAG: DUF262 domain-containing protein [Victivallaceae bacterium]|jgi:hypothetical protein